MDGWRRVHRILAVLFLLSIPPAASFTGDPDSAPLRRVPAAFPAGDRCAHQRLAGFDVVSVTSV
jgi:hypothetical protein